MEIEDILESLTDDQLMNELTRRGFEVVDPLEFTHEDMISITGAQ